MSQGPPLDSKYLYEDIWANQPASQVLSAVLGPNPTVNYVNGNTALGGYEARQMVHGKLLDVTTPRLLTVSLSRLDVQFQLPAFRNCRQLLSGRCFPSQWFHGNLARVPQGHNL
jgi:hypothetical protein